MADNTACAMPSHYFDDSSAAVGAPFGILSPGAAVIVPDDERWITGFDYERSDCSSTVTVSASVGPQTYTVVEGEPDNCYDSYLPFEVGVKRVHSTFNKEKDWQEDVATRLLACQQKAIEHEFWTGQLAKAMPSSPNRYLASTGATDVTPTPGTAVKPAFAAVLLEDALASCGCGISGTIHTTRGVASALGLGGDDPEVAAKTSLGTSVIAGTGYTGSGPTGAVPGGFQQWMYATGPLTVRLSPIDTRSGAVVDTRTNRFDVYADRIAAVTWDSCCHFAVLTDLSADYS